MFIYAKSIMLVINELQFFNWRTYEQSEDQKARTEIYYSHPDIVYSDEQKDASKPRWKSRLTVLLPSSTPNGNLTQ